MMVTRLTPHGYEIELLPAFKNFPNQDAVADTVRMNEELADAIKRSPSQYYWVHKRFKTRPPGEPPVYQL
jgi:KDO2-lipid IV(A) lauroyltransferase